MASSAPEQGGIICAYKPAGPGSPQLVARLRRYYPDLKRGHAGTLDRFAEGVLILLVGYATAIADTLLHAPKSYRATFRFGSSTASHDPHGEVLRSCSSAEAREFMIRNEAAIRIEIDSWRHLTRQRPPDYSALKLAGARASDRVRAGEQIVLPERTIELYRVEISHFDPERCEVEVELDVSGGTYIRSFARDLGDRLDFPLHTSRLIRTRVGPIGLEREEARIWKPLEEEPPQLIALTEAVPLPQLELADAAAVADVGAGRLVALESLLADLPEAGSDFFLTLPESYRHSGGIAVATALCHSLGQGNYRYKRVFPEWKRSLRPE